MNDEQNPESQEMEKIKEIPEWTRKYTCSRMLPFLLFQGIFLFFVAAIGIPSYLGGNAYRAGNMLLFWVCIFALIPVCTALIFFSIPKYGGKWIDQIARRLYGREGIAILSQPAKTKKKRWAVLVAGLIFGSCILVSVILGLFGYIPTEYMMPVSAIYTVPFLVFLIILMSPTGIRPIDRTCFLGLLWPILYAVHAILVVSGVPIQFSGRWDILNMLIPTVGYGILFGLVGHIYNRYALKKLKEAAHLQEDTNEQ
jgi:hypothetical protein